MITSRLTARMSYFSLFFRYPQLSAVIECADAAHGLNGHVISDGGCTCPGDFSKAFGAGADFVMAGGIFAAHAESGSQSHCISSM